MGLLDDLEYKALQLRREEELGKEELARRRVRFQETIRPVVGRIYEYVRELTNHINYLKPENTVVYQVPRFGEIKATIVPDYRIRVSKDDNQASVVIETTAAIPVNTSRVFIEQESRVGDLENALLDAGISARQINHRDHAGVITSASFQVYGNIRRVAVVSCQVLDDDIQFKFTNFDVIGEMERRHSPEEVDDGFMDRLGRFLVAQDSDFLLEVRDEDDRDQIRQQIRERERQGPVLRERDPDPRQGLLSHLRDLWEKPE